MRPKSLLLLALALCCGLVASIGISQVMDRQKNERGPSVNTTQIYVALTDIPVGDKITPEMLQLEDWPSDKVQPTAIKRLEEVVGRVPRTLIVRGDPILTTKLLTGTVHDDPSGMLPKGYRAFPVKLGIEDSTAGLARVGDRVDIHWYVRKNAGRGIDATKIVTLLQNVKIFAINQTVSRAADSERKAVVATTIALQVTPRETKMLNLAREQGQIKLVLRNPEDDADDGDDNVDMDALLTLAGLKADKEAERQISGIGTAEKSPESSPGLGDLAGGFLRAMGQQTQQITTELQSGPWPITVVRGTQVTYETVGGPQPTGTSYSSGLPGLGPNTGAAQQDTGIPQGSSPDDVPGVDLPPVDGGRPSAGGPAGGDGDFSFDPSDFGE